MSDENKVFNAGEVREMVRLAHKKDTRALMELLEETGCRVREILDLRAGDVEFQEGMAVVNVDGKTGPRRVPVIEFADVLRSLVGRKGPACPLFGHKYTTYYHRLHVLMRKAGISKRASFHGFRHYAATRYLRAGMPEQVAKKLFGWSPDSRMMRIYSHMIVDDVAYWMRKINRPETVEMPN